MSRVLLLEHKSHWKCVLWVMLELCISVPNGVEPRSSMSCSGKLRLEYHQIYAMMLAVVDFL